MENIFKAGYFTGILLTAFAVYKLDLILIEGLNYFGKYVFFALFHIVVLYSFYAVFNAQNWKKLIPLFEGIFFLLLDLSLGALQ